MNYASQKFGWYSPTQHMLNDVCKVYKDTDGDPVVVTLVTNSFVTPYINGYDDYIFAGPVVECIQPQPFFVPHEWFPTKPYVDNDPCYADTMTKWLEDQVKADLANTVTNYNKHDNNTFYANPLHIGFNYSLRAEENELAKTNVSKERLLELKTYFMERSYDMRERISGTADDDINQGRADAYNAAAIRLDAVIKGVY